VVLDEFASLVARSGFDFPGTKTFPMVKESLLPLPARSFPTGAALETGFLRI
jgi:hypothetical protein